MKKRYTINDELTDKTRTLEHMTGLKFKATGDSRLGIGLYIVNPESESVRPLTYHYSSEKNLLIVVTDMIDLLNAIEIDGLKELVKQKRKYQKKWAKAAKA